MRERQRLRARYSDGEEPEGGLDIELLYYSPPQPCSDCGVGSTPLSPRVASDSALSSLVGDYSTPLAELTSLTADGCDFQLLRGSWGAQAICVSLTGPDSLAAVFVETGFKIPGEIKGREIHWFGGQIWRKWGLAGVWETGHCRVELDETGAGVWGSRQISVSREGIQISALFDSFTLRGRNFSPDELRWENGQIWRRNNVK